VQRQKIKTIVAVKFILLSFTASAWQVTMDSCSLVRALHAPELLNMSDEIKDKQKLFLHSQRFSSKHLICRNMINIGVTLVWSDAKYTPASCMFFRHG